MPKIVYLTILSVFAFALVTAINIGGVSAREETKFVPVSVLAKDQANYGVDENVNTIPAVSPAIIEDKVHDITLPGSVKTIKYTTLPPRNSGSPVEKNDQQDQSQNDQGNNGTSVSDPNNNNGNSANNGNSNNGNGNNGTGNKNKDKNKSNNGNGNGNGNSSGNSNKTNEKSNGSASNKDHSTQSK